MLVQKTVGVLEALNERINMAQEELRLLDAHNTGFSAGRMASGIWNAVVCIGGLGLIGTGLLLFVRSPSPLIAGSIFAIPGFALFIWSTGRMSRKPPDNTAETQRAEELRATIAQLEQEKRDMLLRHETEIKSGEDDADFKECPMCAELVRRRAKICRHCHHTFVGTAS